VDAPLELTGPVALRLWISSDREDLDVLVRLQHLDADGEPIPAIGPQGGPMPMAIGWLRASHRELDPARSEPYRPWHTHLNPQPLPPGEPTLLEVEIWPTSITLAPGERLLLELVSDDDDLANFAHNDPNDRHPAAGATIHVGGAHRSHLLVPTIPGLTRRTGGGTPAPPIRHLRSMVVDMPVVGLTSGSRTRWPPRSAPRTLRR
jgi:hypothetical protein